MPLSTGLKNQRILVTAASQGIGFGVARAFLGEGARVVINSSNKERLDKAKAELSKLGEVHSIVADLSSRDGIEDIVSKTVEYLGGIDTLAYVTGSPARGAIMEKSYEEWEGAARLLTVSPAYLGRKVGEVMSSSNTKGRMVFSSSFAIREPTANLALSNVCRVAIFGLVRSLARELGPKGIRVNGIMQGYVKTARVDTLVGDAMKRKGITEKQAIDEITSQIPLCYIGTTEEIAKSFLFLGSEMSSYVSGAMLPVDGALLKSVG
ncbi:MAG TPA: SDR family oxidoreductase [Nitrososphaerales archaeon]|nr:SDR family oxidoreductase [Nitrososphaerales archaeon]